MIAKVEQEPEEIRERPVFIVVAVATVITVLAVLVGWWILPAPASDPSAARRAEGIEVGNIFISPLREDPAIGIEAREEARERLESWGWVSREEDVAHVPIDVAMELYLERARRQEER